MFRTLSRIHKAVPSGEDSPSIAIIGCGAVTEWFYLPALAKHPFALSNSILVDRNEVRAQRLAARFHAKNYLVDFRDVLGEGIDGVIVATPTHLHYPISMGFLSQGVHVLCEKPLAESAVEAREMVEQAQKTGAKLLVNYTRRLFPSYVRVKELLAHRALGELLSVKYFEGEEFRWPTVSGFYFNSKVSSRGVLLDKGAHVLDLICWWLGGKPHLTSSQNDSFGGKEAVAEIQFEHDQCIGEVKLSLLGKFACVSVAKCEAGTIESDLYDFRSLVVTKFNQRRRIRLKADEKYYEDFGYKVVTNFLNVINQGAQPLVSGADVLDSMEFIDECYETASRFHMPWYEVSEVHNG